MMRKIVLALACMLTLGAIQAQEKNETSKDGIQNRSIRVGYGIMNGSLNPGQVILHNGLYWGWDNMLNISADLFRINNSISIGAHLGVERASTRETVELPSLEYNTVGLHYGIDLSYSVLGNAGIDTDRWDLRLNANIGAYSFFPITPQLEYGAGISATYYVFDHFGIYADLMWGRFLYSSGSYLSEGQTKIEFGVSYRF